MTSHQQIILEQICSILKNNYEVDESLIFWEADIFKIVGLSFSQNAELAVDLENLFDIELVDASFLKVTSIG